MRARANRTIPLAVTSATLTFGACGEDDKNKEVTQADVTRATAQLASAICKNTQRCESDYFEEEFDNLSDCTEYYEKAYAAEFDDIEEAKDPAGCRRAVKAALDCYTRAYTNLSCDAFEDDYYSDEDDEDDEDICEKEIAAVDAACEHDEE